MRAVRALPKGRPTMRCTALPQERGDVVQGEREEGEEHKPDSTQQLRSKHCLDQWHVVLTRVSWRPSLVRVVLREDGSAQNMSLRAASELPSDYPFVGGPALLYRTSLISIASN